MPHTPGPWDFDGCTRTNEENRRYHQIDGPTPRGVNPAYPYTIADTSNRHHCIDPEEDAANARLIAAAPALLDALKQVVAVADRDTSIFDLARAVIAKAEGRQ